MGDFYETFLDDAETVARVCGITLTSRSFGKARLLRPDGRPVSPQPDGKADRVPLAGIPYHALQTYLGRLIRRGYRVAICEQLNDPATAKGLLDRDVVRIVTPGTVVEPGLLDARRNQYLAALYAEPNRAGLAYADVSTGEFAATQVEGRDWPRALAEELARLGPAECLLPAAREGAAEDAALAGLAAGVPTTTVERWRFDLAGARERLQRHFEVATLDGFGFAGQPLALRAAGALFHYLEETQRGALGQLQPPRCYTTGTFVSLDPATRRTLELTASGRDGTLAGSLLGTLDCTQTVLGGRLLRRWLGQPLRDLAALQARQEAVAAWATAGLLRQECRALLRACPDLERLVARVAQGTAGPRDLVALAAGLRGVAALAERLTAADVPAALAAWAERLDPCPAIADEIGRAIVPEPPATLAEGGVFARGYSAELDQLLADTAEARRWMAGLERQERERTGIKSLKVGYNKVFGYYIEVSHANVGLVPPDYIRKQTLVGAERYITPELKEKEALILSAQEQQVALETRLFRALCQQLAAHRERVVATAQAVAELDVLAALADVAVARRYVRPELDEGATIHIVGGRHPVVEVTLDGAGFVPNDCHLDDKARIIVLTGPNMSGKSTYLRQVALIVLMAQIGSFVPAEQARIGLVDRIFTRVGAYDDISAGQSTFMVEMAEAATILLQSTPRSLALLDEIGRGTSTYDGLAIAKAMVEYLHDDPAHRPKTLFATHYHELAECAAYLPAVRNYRVDVLEEAQRVTFLYKVVPGAADKSYGLHVARLAGVPRAVVRRAQEILHELEQRAALVHGGGLQLPLFAGAAPPAVPDDWRALLAELAALEVERLTPLAALNLLDEMRRRAKELLD
jgi:DNA mismatch repair protein MutS